MTIQRSEIINWIIKKGNLVKLILGLTLLQFIIFKLLYPFPNFLPESTSYIEAAANNQSINFWPIGYSKFLRLFNIFSHSDLSLVLFQYLFLQSSLLYFLFTVAFLLKLKSRVIWLLAIFNVCNPALLHLSNFISSDALFVGLSLYWFSSLIWLSLTPGFLTLCLHAAALLTAFSFRYFALYYPIASALIIVYSNSTTIFKLKSISIIIIPLLLFINHTITEYKTITHTSQFSPFGGWQIAANALYAYSHMALDSSDQVPDRFRVLHSIVNQHMVRLSHIPNRPDSRIGIYYQWDDQAPLKVYLRYYWEKDSNTNDFKRYAIMGNLYADYGIWLIKNHPTNYLKNFVIPNLMDYYAPPTEFMGYYNMGFDSVPPSTAKWFDLRDNKVSNLFKSKKISSSEFFTILFPMINIGFLAGMLALISLKTPITKDPIFKRVFYITLLIWLSNMLFSISTAYIILRYEIFSMIITLSFATIFISILIQQLNEPKATN